MTIERPELVVFDFDETIVACNSDTFINQLAPDGVIPQEIADHWKHDNWTEYMRHVFGYLSKCGVGEKQLKKCLETMPFVDGFKDLILNCRNSGPNRFELLIISDANTVFINHTLEFHQLDKAFRKVFTNPAKFDGNGCLQIQEYHQQDWCKISAKNLCKGQVLMDYVKKRQDDGAIFSRISYIGDGQNDVCPSLKLNDGDRVFARKDFPLHARLKCNKQLKALLHPFNDGLDIWNVLADGDKLNHSIDNDHKVSNGNDLDY